MSFQKASKPAPAFAILPSRMDEPEYLICLSCETPTYTFEFDNGKITSIVCTACGSDEPSEFVTETELEEM